MVWQKGQSGNPKGKPRNPFIDVLTEAIIEVEEEKKLKLMKRYVNRAYEKDIVLMDLVKKLVPDLTHTETVKIKLEDIDKEKKEFINDITSGIESGGAGDKKASSDSSEG